jgi:flagellar biosynthesis/type III secretory pathway protein FliH
MSVVGRARVVRGVSDSTPTRIPTAPQPRAGRVLREEMEARERAAKIIADAEKAAAGVAAKAALEAREAEVAKLAADFLLLRKEDEARAERDLDRAVELALVLAERLVGAALDRDPALVVPLARQALAEARGARRRRIEAHPDDAAALSRELQDLGPDIVIESNEELSRGSLVVHTDLGKLDARLPVQLQRLAAALRQALGRP